MSASVSVPFSTSLMYGDVVRAMSLVYTIPLWAILGGTRMLERPPGRIALPLAGVRQWPAGPPRELLALACVFGARKCLPAALVAAMSTRNRRQMCHAAKRWRQRR